MRENGNWFNHFKWIEEMFVVISFDLIWFKVWTKSIAFSCNCKANENNYYYYYYGMNVYQHYNQFIIIIMIVIEYIFFVYKSIICCFKQLPHDFNFGIGTFIESFGFHSHRNVEPNYKTLNFLPYLIVLQYSLTMSHTESNQLSIIYHLPSLTILI